MSLELGVKTCGAMSELDIRKAAAGGAKAYGVVCSPHDESYYPRSKNSHTRNVEQARLLFKAAPEHMKTVLLTRHSSDFYTIVDMVEATKPDRLQLGETRDPGLTAALSDRFKRSGPEVVQVIPVADDTVPEVIDDYDVGCFLLDSDGKHPGGNGTTHDWRRSSKIAERIHDQDKLVILAGGLTVYNAAEAIAIVQPDGIDVETGIRTHGVFNQGLIQRFTEIAEGNSQVAQL